MITQENFQFVNFMTTKNLLYNVILKKNISFLCGQWRIRNHINQFSCPRRLGRLSHQNCSGHVSKCDSSSLFSSGTILIFIHFIDRVPDQISTDRLVRNGPNFSIFLGPRIPSLDSRLLVHMRPFYMTKTPNFCKGP